MNCRADFGIKVKQAAKSTSSSAPNPQSLGAKFFLQRLEACLKRQTFFAIHAAAAQEKERTSAVSAPAAIQQRKSKEFFDSLWQTEALKKHLRVSQCSWLISTLPAPSLPSPPTEKIFHVHALYSRLSESVSAAALQRRSVAPGKNLYSNLTLVEPQSDLCLFNAVGLSAASPV